MQRKRLTQLFPFLIPLRTKQRKFCYFLKMRFDKNTYCSVKSGCPLPFSVCSHQSCIYNQDTGFDMIYQENKAHNLRLGAAALEGLLIRPGETFSYSLAVKDADKNTPYKDGLIMRDGKLTADYGGGMCQLADLLFSLFLDSPLTITERHGHKIKDFPDPDGDCVLKGGDATVFEGWLDLKVRNDTNMTFQLTFSFPDNDIRGTLLSNEKDRYSYKAANGSVTLKQEQDGLYEEAQVVREKYLENSLESTQLLYVNRCKINYEIKERTA